MYKTKDTVTYEFPKGVGTRQQGKILRVSKDGKKFQTRVSNGRLMWYPTECIIEQGEDAAREKPQPKAKPVKIQTNQSADSSEQGAPTDTGSKEGTKDVDQPAQEDLAAENELDKISKDAEEKLKNIQLIKKSKKKASKKGTVKAQIIEMIKAGKSNKEILDELKCGNAYPSTVREQLYNAGEIGEDLLYVRHGRGFKKPDFDFNQDVGDPINVYDRKGTKYDGEVVEPENHLGMRNQLTVEFADKYSIVTTATFSRKTGEQLNTQDPGFQLTKPQS